MDVYPGLNLNVDYHYFLADKAAVDISQEIGQEVNLIAAYKILPKVSIMVSANKFFTGTFFNDAAGSNKDLNYFYAQTQFEF